MASSVRPPFGGIFSPAVPSFGVTLKDNVDMVEMVIRNLALEGNVVIVGRGGQVLLRDTPCALHVLIVAPFERRVFTLVEREGIEERDASARLRASDRARMDYLRRYHGVDWLDPSLYDVAINTFKISSPLAAELIVQTFKQLPGHGNG
ncbi:MAG: cytidylate kinase-like family protein [Anaerolineae bacterium]